MNTQDTEASQATPKVDGELRERRRDVKEKLTTTPAPDSTTMAHPNGGGASLDDLEAPEEQRSQEDAGQPEVTILEGSTLEGGGPPTLSVDDKSEYVDNSGSQSPEVEKVTEDEGRGNGEMEEVIAGGEDDFVQGEIDADSAQQPVAAEEARDVGKSDAGEEEVESVAESRVGEGVETKVGELTEEQPGLSTADIRRNLRDEMTQPMNVKQMMRRPNAVRSLTLRGTNKVLSEAISELNRAGNLDPGKLREAIKRRAATWCKNEIGEKNEMLIAEIVSECMAIAKIDSKQGDTTSTKVDPKTTKPIVAEAVEGTKESESEEGTAEAKVAESEQAEAQARKTAEKAEQEAKKQLLQVIDQQSRLHGTSAFSEKTVEGIVSRRENVLDPRFLDDLRVDLEYYVLQEAGRQAGNQTLTTNKEPSFRLTKERLTREFKYYLDAIRRTLSQYSKSKNAASTARVSRAKAADKPKNPGLKASKDHSGSKQTGANTRRFELIQGGAQSQVPATSQGQGAERSDKKELTQQVSEILEVTDLRAGERGLMIKVDKVISNEDLRGWLNWLAEKLEGIELHAEHGQSFLEILAEKQHLSTEAISLIRSHGTLELFLSITLTEENSFLGCLEAITGEMPRREAKEIVSKAWTVLKSKRESRHLGYFLDKDQGARV